jgi:hypothetical protein
MIFYESAQHAQVIKLEYAHNPPTQLDLIRMAQLLAKGAADCAYEAQQSSKGTIDSPRLRGLVFVEEDGTVRLPKSSDI